MIMNGAKTSKVTCLFAILTFTLFSNALFSQSFSSFLKSEGYETLAAMAHPSNTFWYGTHEIVRDGAVINIYYANDIHTEIKVYQNSQGLVYDLYVISENDWFPPFLGAELIKDLLYDFVKEIDGSTEVTSAYEKYFNRAMYEWSGKQMAITAMSLSWLSYQ